jgi:ABC-type amino acid transport substrate-binding protein
VGFDVEMAHMLAEDLDVDLEFVPFVFERLDRMLDSGQIDIAMSCVASLPDRYAKASFSRSYLDLTMALVVRDHSRSEFSDIVQLQRRQENLTLAVVGNTYFARKLQRLLPGATLRVLESAEKFFASAEGELDALLISAEEGAAYTYRYPHYSVVEIEGGSVRVPAAYAIPRDDARMREFVSNWVDLKRKEGAVESLYAYWMLGGAAQRHAPRWSVIRDVLGWID